MREVEADGGGPSHVERATRRSGIGGDNASAQVVDEVGGFGRLRRARRVGVDERDRLAAPAGDVLRPRDFY